MMKAGTKVYNIFIWRLILSAYILQTFSICSWIFFLSLVLIRGFKHLTNYISASQRLLKVVVKRKGRIKPHNPLSILTKRKSAAYSLSASTNDFDPCVSPQNTQQRTKPGQRVHKMSQRERTKGLNGRIIFPLSFHRRKNQHFFQFQYHHLMYQNC